MKKNTMMLKKFFDGWVIKFFIHISSTFKTNSRYQCYRCHRFPHEPSQPVSPHQRGDVAGATPRGTSTGR
uniref:Uncharacterized protein n=1 Tax=Yersinia enterocolitica TaxID=630 RepID=B0RL36_YEREN|nr:hypothetical protein [Yersinia enterocolitica]